jgi:cellulose synthase operon protein C
MSFGRAVLVALSGASALGLSLCCPIRSNLAQGVDGRPATRVGGATETYPLNGLRAGETYRLHVGLSSGALGVQDRAEVELNGPDGATIRKALHAGDPDFYLPYRPNTSGNGTVVIRAESGSKPLPISFEWGPLSLSPEERPAIEAEPNNDWKHANPLILGRDVYGSADDVDYLDNAQEGKAGLDWFKLEISDESPVLVYFQLDLLDRDVSANLRVVQVDSRGNVVPEESGKDPMEIVHDRERERYSKHISRVLSKGTYYLEVNANHPDYILRTRKLPVPPYQNPALAVEAGMHYIINVGDAWFAQVPREGNIFVRAANIHDTGTRCTACHPSSFSTEANLVAHRNGYPIRSKSDFLYVMDRIANSITPLYGDDGLYWQRFIAIPLQAQGKQGGILADFEREVSGRKTAALERFGPFLKAAWADRTDLPPDEQNGVVPLDSKFGFAWRDWRVLTEMANRTRRDDYRRAAANVARLLTDPDTDKRIETLQDRIHRLYAWSLIDKEGNADRIAREAEGLLSLQNDDGGWFESESKKEGSSAVYTTGQLTWTLLRLGYSKDDARVARALRYLLSQQQPFGGWLQTTTHENFRTPMRETRFAVEALAEAFPRPAAPLLSWGNRDDGPARLPRQDSVVHTLDDLENLWDVPPTERGTYAIEIAKLLEHSEPLVRASAAACLGRLEREEPVTQLIKRLADPSKIVWRSAAWALRRIGNAGQGVEVIKSALYSPDPRVRRGAARIFAYQFHGMDERLDIAYRLIDLTDDPDLWTRLQALKTLRQWFYRTRDANFQRRVIRAYLAHMAVPELPVVRKNLSEGMYIMLDENLGGGVSLQKNIASLPAAMRPAILEARKKLEWGVLLKPILATLESGNDLQREAIVRSFDGSFFKGRFFARRPEGMLDVGNDREFGFLYEPPTDVLERTFSAVFQKETRADVRRQVLQLSSFFRVSERGESAEIQIALLSALTDPDSSVREAARKAVGDDLSLRGVESDPARVERVAALLRGGPEAQRVIVRAIGRNPAVAERPEIAAALKAVLHRDDGAVVLQPVLSLSLFSDAERVRALTRAWPNTTDPADRLALLELLFSRRELLNVESPPEAALELLRSAITDPSALVRERTLAVVSGLDALWAGKVSNGILLAAMSDDTPALRLLGLKLAAPKAAFWSRSDARELLLRLLVDPDAKVRDQALGRVEQHRLAGKSSAIAKRVKVLEADPTLKDRALATLVSQGIDPKTVIGDVTLTRPKLLSLSSFRKNVNPLFYQPAEDTYACVKCHANHTILRIAEADPNIGFSGEQLMTNYNSVLKVINLGDPESSLVLRKPRSPQGPGGAEDSSPTGLTHVGGPRWENTEHSAYKAVLAWIREASSVAASTSLDSRLTADSYSPSYEPANAGDGDLSTVWHTEFVGASPGYPHELVVDLGDKRRIDGLLYVPHQESSKGRVKEYEIRVSDDGKTWSASLASGSWSDDPTFKFVALPGRIARYVQLRGLSEVNGLPYMSAAEVAIESTAEAKPARSSN